MAENPGIEKIEDLLKNVHNGSFVIPYFQRSFEWWPSMVCDLVESILQKYYTGLILLWEERLFSILFILFENVFKSSISS